LTSSRWNSTISHRTGAVEAATMIGVGEMVAAVVEAEEWVAVEEAEGNVSLG
jgi:hypothetical protein